MNPLTVSAVSFAGLFAFICAAWELTVGRRDRHGRRLLARVGIKGERAGSPASPAEAWHLRFWRSAKKALSASSPARPEWTDRWLVPSILAGGLIGAYGTFHVLRALGNAHPAGGILVGAAAGAGAGWALCRRWQRQWWAGEMAHGLIDLLDLWIMCLDAGMSFQAALARAAQDSELARPVLRRELLLTHQEMMAGCPSEEALRHLVARCRNVPEMSGLVSHIIQSEKLGGSIAKTLQVYANSLRFNRYQDMKENVQKMPAKLAFPLIFCILPCLLIVIAGPAILRLFEVLGRH